MTEQEGAVLAGCGGLLFAWGLNALFWVLVIAAAAYALKWVLT